MTATQHTVQLVGQLLEPMVQELNQLAEKNRFGYPKYIIVLVNRPSGLKLEVMSPWLDARPGAISGWYSSVEVNVTTSSQPDVIWLVVEASADYDPELTDKLDQAQYTISQFSELVMDLYDLLADVASRINSQIQ